jgi:hypothetical protein
MLIAAWFLPRRARSGRWVSDHLPELVSFEPLLSIAKLNLMEVQPPAAGEERDSDKRTMGVVSSDGSPWRRLTMSAS